MPVDVEGFKRALSQFASGVTVVTARGPARELLGLTVSSFCSVSLQPPMVLVCIDERSEANVGLAPGSTFGISVLREGQEDVSRLFAWGGPDKFERAALVDDASGVPLVTDALAHLVCRTAAAHAAGDHQVYFAIVERAVASPGRPLVYHRGDYRRLENVSEG
jgi:flavin reductase (DIM6/NTAB) family NADH-FMN oxidoreductase RutF